jgi:hypothetical protein
MFVWQGLEHRRIDEAEDRTVGTNSQRQRQNSHSGKPGRFRKHARAVPEILDELVKHMPSLVDVALDDTPPRKVGRLSCGK